MSNNLSFKDVFIKGAVVYNPVLIQLVGLCPVVAASTSLARAAMLSAVLCIELIVTCLIASALFKKFPRWIRVPLYLIIGTAIICPLLWYIEARSLIDLSLSMKIYIPLIAVNSMTAVHCEQFSVKNSVKLSLYDAAAAGFGASLVFIAVGAIRELLGASTIGGINVDLPITFKGMTLPFGCLILLGFMAAGLKAFVNRKNSESDEPEEVEEFETYEEPEEVETFEAYEEPGIMNGTEIFAEENSEVAEVEIFDEFWNKPEETPEEEPQEVPLQLTENLVTETKTYSNAELEKIDELFRSLGLDNDIKGDAQ